MRIILMSKIVHRHFFPHLSLYIKRLNDKQPLLLEGMYYTGGPKNIFKTNQRKQ